MENPRLGVVLIPVAAGIAAARALSGVHSPARMLVDTVPGGEQRRPAAGGRCIAIATRLRIDGRGTVGDSTRDGEVSPAADTLVLDKRGHALTVYLPAPQ
ncbi:hypothetical protein ACFQ2B_36005 [Streptomyces stramineus]|uniref:NfeD-like C-terminal domain-containing protein n=1 Tax=Streptomyces stramineus TaxID=173861 RepID=A0ABN0ZCD4_9ACTN